MNWPHTYIGLPFLDGGRTARGLDCWGLVKLVYHDRLDIDLPSYGEITAAQLIKVARAIKTGMGLETWSKTDTPQEFDVVVMKARSLVDGHMRMQPLHVGIWLKSNRVLHIENGVNAADVSLNHSSVKNRIYGVFKYVG